MYNPMPGTQGMPGMPVTYGAPMWGMQQRMMPMQSQTQPQRAEIVRVTGMDGAKAFLMEPNCSAALFDAEAPIFYLKVTDGAGFPTIKAYDYTPHQEAAPEKPDYVTRKEFNEWKEALQNERVSGDRKRAGNAKQSDE